MSNQLDRKYASYNKRSASAANEDGGTNLISLEGMGFPFKWLQTDPV